MAKHLAQLVISGIQVVGRAFGRALQNEIRASQEAAKYHYDKRGNSSETAANNSLSSMTLQEAKQILGVSSLEEVEKIQKSFEHLFKINEKSNGGSFYLQSKVVRAKERIDMELSKISNEEPHNSQKQSE